MASKRKPNKVRVYKAFDHYFVKYGDKTGEPMRFDDAMLEASVYSAQSLADFGEVSGVDMDFDTFNDVVDLLRQKEKV